MVRGCRGTIRPIGVRSAAGHAAGGSRLEVRLEDADYPSRARSPVAGASSESRRIARRGAGGRPGGAGRLLVTCGARSAPPRPSRARARCARRSSGCPLRRTATGARGGGYSRAPWVEVGVVRDGVPVALVAGGGARCCGPCCPALRPLRTGRCACSPPSPSRSPPGRSASGRRRAHGSWASPLLRAPRRDRRRGAVLGLAPLV